MESKTILIIAGIAVVGFVLWRRAHPMVAVATPGAAAPSPLAANLQRAVGTAKSVIGGAGAIANKGISTVGSVANTALGTASSITHSAGNTVASTGRSIVHAVSLGSLW